MFDLTDLMDMAEEFGRGHGATEELLYGYLFVMNGCGDVRVNVLAMPGGVYYAHFTRKILTLPGAVAAALLTEAWVSKEMTPAAMAAHRAAGGEIRTLPPDQRRDALFIFGETAGGLEQTRIFSIEPPTTPGGPRTFERDNRPELGTAYNRFRPLFGPGRN